MERTPDSLFGRLSPLRGLCSLFGLFVQTSLPLPQSSVCERRVFKCAPSRFHGNSETKM